MDSLFCAGGQFMNRIRTSAYCVVAALLVCRAHAFDTTINIDSFNLTAPSFIGSNTQLNVTKTGRMPLEFQAGAEDGSSVNVEFNFSSIRADKISAYAGSEVNLSGGYMWDKVTSYSGSTINVFDGATIFNFFAAEVGGTINVYGGSIHDRLRAANGGQVNLIGGTVGYRLTAFEGGKIHVSGGRFGDELRFSSTSEFNISGSEFRVNGVALGGLKQVGDIAQVNLPPNSVVSGTLADGSPFAISDQDGDVIADGSLRLIEADVPAAGPFVADVVSVSSLTGLRSGQQLNVQSGGQIGRRFTAGPGSIVNLEGGEIGYDFEAVGSQINIFGGIVKPYFNAFHGTHVNVTGGTIGGSFAAANGSVVRISGGEIEGSLRAHAGSDVEISGGTLGDGFHAHEGASIKVFGGDFGERFYALAGTNLTIAGGTFGDDFRGYGGSNINFRGTEFLLDGVPIEGLVPGVATLISDRDMLLSGVFADGSPFSFELNPTDYEREKGYFDPYWRPYDLFAAEALVSVTLVPEPSVWSFSALFLGMVSFVALCRTQRTSAVSVYNIDYLL
jgi:hypothetical protein